MIPERFYRGDIDDDEPYQTRSGIMEDQPDTCMTETSAKWCVPVSSSTSCISRTKKT